MSAPMTATCAPREASCGCRNRPRPMPKSRRSARVGVVPLMAAFSNFLAPAVTSPTRCTVTA